MRDSDLVKKKETKKKIGEITIAFFTFFFFAISFLYRSKTIYKRKYLKAKVIW